MTYKALLAKYNAQCECVKVLESKVSTLEGTVAQMIVSSQPTQHLIIDDANFNLPLLEASVIYITYNGIGTATAIIPTLETSEWKRWIIINQGGGILTLNTTGGDDDIYGQIQHENMFANGNFTPFFIFGSVISCNNISNTYQNNSFGQQNPTFGLTGKGRSGGTSGLAERINNLSETEGRATYEAYYSNFMEFDGNRKRFHTKTMSGAIVLKTYGSGFNGRKVTLKLIGVNGGGHTLTLDPEYKLLSGTYNNTMTNIIEMEWFEGIVLTKIFNFATV